MRLDRESARDRDALAHALAELVAIVSLELVEADPAQPFARDLAPVRHLTHLETELDVLEGGAPRHHAVPREHIADVVAHAGHDLAVDLRPAPARRQEARDDVEQGRLAAA